MHTTNRERTSPLARTEPFSQPESKPKSQSEPSELESSQQRLHGCRRARYRRVSLHTPASGGCTFGGRRNIGFVFWFVLPFSFPNEVTKNPPQQAMAVVLAPRNQELLRGAPGLSALAPGQPRRTILLPGLERRAIRSETSTPGRPA